MTAAEQQRMDELTQQNEDLREQIQELSRQLQELGKPAPAAASAPSPLNQNRVSGHDIAQEVIKLILKDARIIELRTVKPELRVNVTREVVNLDGKTLRGKLAGLIATKYFDTPRNGNMAFVELKRLGFPTAKPNVYRECDTLAEMGFLTKEEGGYLAVEGMKVNIVKS